MIEKEPMRPWESLKQGLIDLSRGLPKNCVMAEIGSYAGESAEIFLRNAKIEKLYCIDPWENNYDDSDPGSSKFDMKDVEALFDERMLPYADRVVKIKEKSNVAALIIPDSSLDFVYIDGCHQYEAVKQDILTFRPKIKPCGIIGGHDMGDQFGGVQRAVLETLGNPDIIFCDSSWIKLL